jgi:sugar fermentation stimulation protein A
LAHVEIDGKEVKAHVPDPGRLKELLLPDAEVLVRHNPSPGRKTDWTLTLVKKDEVWVCINTTIPNAFVNRLLEGDHLPEFDRFEHIQPEAAYENSRFDFYLQNDESEYWLEVKSVSLVNNGIGLFPDAPTTRGTRHLDHLINIRRGGAEAGVLFMVQRSDATKFAPNWITDPDFSATLKKAHDLGVEITVYTSEVEKDGISLGERIDVDLDTEYPLPEM